MNLTSGQQSAIDSLTRNNVPMSFNMIWADVIANGGLRGLWFNTMHSLEKKGLVRKYFDNGSEMSRSSHVLWELVK